MGGARVTTLVTLGKCTLGHKRVIKTLKFVSASTKGFKGGLAWIKPSKKDMAVTFSYSPRPPSALLLRLLCHHPCNPLPHPSVPRAADKAAKLEAEKKAAADEAAKLEAEKKAAAGASPLGRHRPLPNQHTPTHLSPARTRHLTSPTVTTHYHHRDPGQHINSSKGTSDART